MIADLWRQEDSRVMETRRQQSNEDTMETRRQQSYGDKKTASYEDNKL